MALKLHCVSLKVCRYVFPNLPKKKNLTAIPLIHYSRIQSIERDFSMVLSSWPIRLTFVVA